MRLPRGVRTAASIQIECDPVSSGAPQVMSAVLNGSPLGAVELRPGWQAASFPARRRDWQIGHNDLTLSFAVVEPAAGGENHGVRISRVRIGR